MPAVMEQAEQLGLDLGIAPLRERSKAKRARSDALPEYTRYRDDGCDIHDECLTCPLPRCRYEEPGGLRAILNEHRDRQIVQLRRKGVSVDELARRFTISRRTVFRVLGAHKNARRRPKTLFGRESLPAALRRRQGVDREVGEQSRVA